LLLELPFVKKLQIISIRIKIKVGIFIDINYFYLTQVINEFIQKRTASSICEENNFRQNFTYIATEHRIIDREPFV
jgi:hypothetical protein